MSTMLTMSTTMSNVNICSHLIKAAQQTPENLAIVVQKKRALKLTYQSLNFQQLHLKSDHIAYALNQYGLKQGDKVVLMVKPSLEFFCLTFALFKVGLIPILVDPGMGIKNLKQCFIEAKPDVFIGIAKAHIARKIFAWGKDSIKSNIAVAPFAFPAQITLGSILKRYPFPKNYSQDLVLLAQDAMAAILFTSGSTGSPKGVVYTHAIFEAQIKILKQDYQIKNGERDLATFPLFSLFGPALGMASIVPEMDASKPIKANAKYLFAAIERYQCSNLFANPALLDVLGKAGSKQKTKLTSLKRVISAGAPATLPSIKRFLNLLNKNVEVFTSYGATEALPISFIGSSLLLTTQKQTDNGLGICVGKTVQNTQVKIIEITDSSLENLQDTTELAINQIGEIIVQGEQVTKSYYNRDKETKLAKIQDGSSFYHRMGDVGYLDDKGQLWMCGRKKHRVVTETKTYFSIPCERIINTHRAIKRSALVAIILQQKTIPVICLELENNVNKNLCQTELFEQLKIIAKEHQQTQAIELFFIVKQFPMDIRHNAKIFREKLAVVAQQHFDKE